MKTSQDLNQLLFRTVYKTYSQCLGKTHDSITNELKLCFHFEFFWRKSFISATVHIKPIIVWRPTASGVFTFELLFPEFHKPRISPIVLRREIEEILFETSHFKCQWLNRHGSLYLQETDLNYNGNAEICKLIISVQLTCIVFHTMMNIFGSLSYLHFVSIDSKTPPSPAITSDPGKPTRCILPPDSLH